MILADTSVWVEFFRNREPLHARLRELLQRGAVLGVECVFGELLSGARSRRESDLLESCWKSLPKLDESALWLEAGKFCASGGLPARGIGLVDAAVLALAARSGAAIWSLDRRLLDAAAENRINSARDGPCP